MVGTILNVGAIVGGGALGLLLAKELSGKAQYRIKMILGVLTIYVGMSTFWQSLSGGFLAISKQIFIALAALVAGNAIGRALGLQKRLNGLGEYARKTLEKQTPGNPSRFAEGFVTCAILFCVGPMAILGAMEDGLTGQFRTLGIKSVMDGLATMAFVKTFGPGPMLAAVPVLAYQGSITLGAKALQPMLADPVLWQSFNATGGLLVLCISVVILDIQKVPLANYLPSLVVAPVLAWLFR